MQITQESAGKPYNKKQLFLVLNFSLIVRSVYLLRKFISCKETVLRQGTLVSISVPIHAQAK